MSTFPHIRVSGGPRDRGLAYGEQARDRIALSIQAYHEVFAHYAGWDWAKVTAEALSYQEPIRRLGSRYLEEIEGIAAGAGVGIEDILAINTRTEVMFAARARDAKKLEDLPAECTAFAVLPEVADGRTLIGQNWDWLLHSSDTVVVLEVQQTDGPDYVTVVEAGLLAKTGFNSSGVGLVTNALVTDADAGQPGLPYHILLRAILDAETISDALSTLQSGSRSSSANYLIAHRDGVAVDIEAAPGDFTRLFLMFPNRGVLLHTNHFVSPSFDGKDVGMWVMPDSAFRLERARSAIDAVPRVLDFRVFCDLLSDHANFPSGVCCHPDPRLHQLERGSTVASILMDLDARQMLLADGQPCSTPYRALDYKAFLSKPSPLREGAVV